MPAHSYIYRLGLVILLSLVPAFLVFVTGASGSGVFSGGSGTGDIRTGEEKAAFEVDYVLNPDDCFGNIPDITNHYIVIRGKKYDTAKKQWYYLFYEVGTGSLIKGTSFENRLYIDDNNNIIEGNTAYVKNYSGNYYIVTEIRKNIGKTY
jgi:hypothetical protein